MIQKIKGIIEYNKIIDKKEDKILELVINIILPILIALTGVILTIISTIISTVDIKTSTVLLDTGSEYYKYVLLANTYFYLILVMVLGVPIISCVRVGIYRLKYGDKFFK